MSKKTKKEVILTEEEKAEAEYDPLKAGSIAMHEAYERMTKSSKDGRL